jgi:hypothetical protein
MTEAVLWPDPPKKVGNRYEYGPLTFWAEGGGIYVHDSKPKPGEEERKSVMLPGWRDRIIALRGYLQRAESDAHVGSPQEIKWKAQHCFVIRKLVEAMYDVGRQALNQGDLTRESVQKYYRDHVATVKQTHLVPGTILPH